MSLFATGVTVVTSVDDEGNPHSMTANSFTSVCLDPPTVLICVAHGTHTYGYVEHSGKFGINILGEDQEDLGIYFAKRPEDRQEGTEYNYTISDDEIPVLDNSMVFFGCQVVGSHVLWRPHRLHGRGERGAPQRGRGAADVLPEPLVSPRRRRTRVKPGWV